MLSTTKNKAVVGLDVEAGSVAATEVASNGDSAVAKFGVAPLGAGVFSEGEVSDPEALGDALKELFSNAQALEDRSGRDSPASGWRCGRFACR